MRAKTSRSHSARSRRTPINCRSTAANSLFNSDRERQTPSF